MFKGLFLLIDREPQKGVALFLIIFMSLCSKIGSFGDSRINGYDAFLELSWGKVPVTLRARVLLQ